LIGVYPERGESNQFLADNQLMDLGRALIRENPLLAWRMTGYSALMGVGTRKGAALAGDRYRLPNIVQLADDPLVIHIFGPACRG
jgi:hypothetical protein